MFYQFASQLLSKMYYNAIGKTYLAKINKCSMINPIQLFLLSEMNYSAEETLRIQLPSRTRNGTDQEFSVLAKCDASHIKSLIIQQDKYDRYQYYYSRDQLVIIPETISRFVAVETITINAFITELPVALSKLTNLKLLDLTGCYNLLSIPEEILEMKDLKIKIGGIISRASEVVFITVPLYRITPEVFSMIKSANKKRIEQLIIRQMPPAQFGERPQERFEVPDEIKDFTELKMLCITGNISSVPSWIGNMSRLCSLTVSYSSLVSLPSSIGNLANLTSLDLRGCENLQSLPESIGNLSHITSLNLSWCKKLVSLPESMANLSQLTSLDLSRCSNLKCFPSSMQNLTHLTNVKLTNCSFESIPSGIEYLKEVTELDLSGCWNLVSLPSSIWNLSNLTSLDLSNCENLVSLPSSIGNLSHLTSLNLSRCINLPSIPASLLSINHLNLPERIAGIFPIPSDMDWSEFKRDVNVVSYVEYMMRMNKISSILEDLMRYMRQFDSEDYYFRGYDISTVYGWISRRERRGNDLIGYLCLMLTNDWKMKRERGYVKEIVKWRNYEKKRDGLECLRILFMNVYGMEIKRELDELDGDEEGNYDLESTDNSDSSSTVRRMREVWR